MTHLEDCIKLFLFGKIYVALIFLAVLKFIFIYIPSSFVIVDQVFILSRCDYSPPGFRK